MHGLDMCTLCSHVHIPPSSDIADGLSGDVVERLSGDVADGLSDDVADGCAGVGIAHAKYK